VRSPSRQPGSFKGLRSAEDGPFRGNGGNAGAKHLARLQSARSSCPRQGFRFPCKAAVLEAELPSRPCSLGSIALLGERHALPGRSRLHRQPTLQQRSIGHWPAPQRPNRRESALIDAIRLRWCEAFFRFLLRFLPCRWVLRLTLAMQKVVFESLQPLVTRLCLGASAQVT
jgi:hypothetical protein